MKECNYCGTQRKDIKAPIPFRIVKDNDWKICDSARAFVIKIKYCPMCGRYLD